MCGLVGVYSFKNNIIENNDYINWAVSTMNRRGPDKILKNMD